MDHDDSSSPLAAEAIAGVTAPPLRTLLADHWEWTMRASPVWATQLGDHRFDVQLSARDAATIARHHQELRGFLERARGLGALDGVDRVTLELFVGELEAAVAGEVCHDEQWHVSIGENPYSELASLVEQTKLRGPEDATNLVARLGQTPAMVDDTLANLTAGLASGRVATVEGVRRTLAMLDTELAKPTADWSMVAPAHDSEIDGFAANLTRVVEEQVRPAIQRYRDFVSAKVLPVARDGADEGIGALPDGDQCYRAAILDHLGFARTPEELHQLGLDEIERIDAALAALGAKALGTTDLASTIDRLRTDRSLYFDSAEALVAASQADLDRARAAIPDWFGRLPKTDCVVSVIPEHEAPYTTIAYYQPPHPDGTKDGEFFINTFRPETRPRFELATLAAHESIPGHHLQIAIAQELGEVPAFRKYGGSTAYVEGWALYTERLADEMGLYRTDLDRIGMLSYEAWRASRLVVDTGLHAMKWTRAQAEQFMLEHTALTPENVSNEVDRYISWPGQALAYKVGQLEILKLRAEAEAALGDRFDIKGFHDAVLGQGAVTLPVLREQVEAWLQSVE
jgi:uncharacterized protein (DUF885 family)